jgi:2-oxoisovalerate dehydrogenase E1 component
MRSNWQAAGVSLAIGNGANAWYSRAFLIRSFEQSLLSLFAEGKLFGTVHTCIGQEFSGIAVAAHIEPGDLIFSNHRCHGHYLARTGDSEGLMAEIMGRASGVCEGRGGSQHICADGFFSSGIQGGILPVAAGLALAQELTARGGMVVAFIGDGTLGEGVLYETFNLVSKWKIPMAIVLENNGYAQSTASAQTLAGDILARAEAFGIPAYQGNTWDPEALMGLMGKVMREVRGQRRPAFVCVDTYRLMAHSKGDDNRPESERQHYWAIDPLTRFAAEHPEEAAEMRSTADREVRLAINAALAAPFTEVSPDQAPPLTSPVWARTEIEGQERVASRIYSALREKLESDQRAFLLGEDIEWPYGGAFKVTRDLSRLFPGRVRNTPISEAAIVGMATGLALAGLRPVCEIMFGDFLALAADQIINHAAKFHWMYDGKVSAPVVIRTPMGGRRGYGPTHSQSIEKHFLGIPGTRVLAVHHRYDPCLLYRRLFATIDRPTLVIENKVLYGETVSARTAAGFWCEHTSDDFPTTRIRSGEKPDITIVCYGGLLSEAERALDRLFEERDIVAEIICPTQIYPLCIDPILQSVRASQRLLVVEEGQLFCGFGAELLASVHQACAGISLVMRRLGAKRHPIPSSRPAEAASLPDADSIYRECLDAVSCG